MNSLSIARSALLAITFWGMAVGAQAQWSLDSDNSSVEFISTKNSSVAESHSFGSLSGSVGVDGSVGVTIELDSVETLIEIRNERVRKMLFETASFPRAKIAASVDAAVLQEILEGGNVVTVDMPVSVSLHGLEKSLNASVVLTRTSGGGVLAVTARPILVKASDFGLEKGIELLRQVAGLTTISSAVPVSFRLQFDSAQQ